MRNWQGALIGFGSRLDVCVNSVTPSPGFWPGCVGQTRRTFHARTLALRRTFDQAAGARCRRAERPARHLVDNATHTLTAASNAMGRLLHQAGSTSAGQRSPAPLLTRADESVTRSRRIGPRLINAIGKACSR
jgi:hypothetical protein